MLTIGSLFSGIGGLELGLEWAGLGPVRWQVERDEFCQRVLAKHWPGVRRYRDIRGIAKLLEPVDLICGGFPCQDVSSAGSRRGLDGERSGLWTEFARVVAVQQPAIVVVENVASGATLWVDSVVRDLVEQGYEALPVPLSAADVGASHARERVFVVACHIDRKGKLAGSEHAEVEGSPRVSQVGWETAEPSVVRVGHGVSGGLDRSRIRALGNSVVPQCAEAIGWVIRHLLLRGEADARARPGRQVGDVGLDVGSS